MKESPLVAVPTKTVVGIDFSVPSAFLAQVTPKSIPTPLHGAISWLIGIFNLGGLLNFKFLSRQHSHQTIFKDTCNFIADNLIFVENYELPNAGICKPE